MTSPSLYQVISAAGLAPEALQVRLCRVWALRRTTGPPSTTGSDGGTVKQNKHTTQNNTKGSLQLPASTKKRTGVELVVALRSASIYHTSKRSKHKEILLMAMCLFNKMQFQTGGRTKNCCHLEKK